MRKLLTLALVLAVASLGAPAGLLAQSPAPKLPTIAPQLATISGETVDAGGRALVNQRVELVHEGEVIATTMSGSRGEWSFSNVAAADYVARGTFSGQVAGVRVSVVAGAPFVRAVIVAPSAAAPSAVFLAPLGLLGGILAGAGVITAIVVTAVVVSGS